MEFVYKYMECGGLDKNSLLIYRMTWVNRINKGNYRVYSITRVNMGTQDI